MAQETTLVEPITAEPVIVEVSDAQQPKASASEAPAVAGSPGEDNGAGKPKPEDAPKASRGRRQSPSPPPGKRDTSRSRSRSHSRNRSRSRSRRRSVSPYRRRGSVIPPGCTVLKDSKTLEKILDLTDVCVNSAGRHYTTSYVTCHALHETDVEKTAWLLTSGTPDAWVQRPGTHRTVSAVSLAQYHYPGRTRGPRRFDTYDDDSDYDDDADSTPIVRLGTSLRVFRGDASMISKVKFVIAVEGRKSSAWAKLLICYSREAALTSIIHEIFCGRSITFVGAVLQDALIPASLQTGNPAVRFKWASCLQELEEAEEGVIGVVC